MKASLQAGDEIYARPCEHLDRGRASRLLLSCLMPYLDIYI